MGKDVGPASQPVALPAQGMDLQQRLSEAINGLLASGAPVALISEWLKQEDLAAASDLQEHFAAFMAAKAPVLAGQTNSQPMLTA